MNKFAKGNGGSSLLRMAHERGETVGMADVIVKNSAQNKTSAKDLSDQLKAHLPSGKKRGAGRKSSRKKKNVKEEEECEGRRRM